MNARIDWTVSWDQVPAKDKGMLYDIVRGYILSKSKMTDTRTRPGNRTHFSHDSWVTGPPRKL